MKCEAVKHSDVQLMSEKIFTGVSVTSVELYIKHSVEVQYIKGRNAANSLYNISSESFIYFC